MELRHTANRQARLSTILREDMQLSAGLMNRMKWKQAILVNGIPQHTDYSVQPGDVVMVLLAEEMPEYPPQEGKLQIVFEDDHLLAVEKPAGMLIHPSRCCNTGTLANFVAGYYRNKGASSAFHPVTRLDRDTFGIVLLAKNPHIHHLLQAQAIQKTYHALVWGGPEEDTGEIDLPIARRPLPSLLRQVHSEGKPSLTRYQILGRGEQYSKLALEPVTGRTHQLRVHCAYMGFPILGDPQYGSEESLAFSKEAGIHTQALCAKRLSFVHPVTGESMVLESNMDVE